MKRYFVITYCIVIALTSLTSCDNPPQMPKPSTYLRLEVDKPNYKLFEDEEFPFKFNYDGNAKIEKPDSKTNLIKWLNIYYDKYNYVINASYIPLKTDSTLRISVNDCYKFLKRHEKLSGGIIQKEYANDERKVYGTVFEIKGRDVVSPYQFYVTDSAHYFVRFALNADFLPNNDSCEAIIKQLKTDMDMILESLSWK